MPTPESPPRALSLMQLWLTMSLSSLVFAVLLVVVHLVQGPEPVAPAWRDYTLIVTGVAILPSILSVRAFRERLAQSWRLGEEERVRVLQTPLVVGLALADLPVLAGFLHAYLTGERWVLMVAALVTLVIVARYRPEAGRPM